MEVDCSIGVARDNAVSAVEEVFCQLDGLSEAEAVEHVDLLRSLLDKGIHLGFPWYGRLLIEIASLEGHWGRENLVPTACASALSLDRERAREELLFFLKQATKRSMGDVAVRSILDEMKKADILIPNKATAEELLSSVLRMRERFPRPAISQLIIDAVYLCNSNYECNVLAYNAVENVAEWEIRHGTVAVAWAICEEHLMQLALAAGEKYAHRAYRITAGFALEAGLVLTAVSVLQEAEKWGLFDFSHNQPLNEDLALYVRCLLALGRPEDLTIAFAIIKDKNLSQAPITPSPWLLCAEAAWREGNLQKAETVLSNMAIPRAEEHLRFTLKGRICCQQGLYSDAVEALYAALNSLDALDRKAAPARYLRYRANLDTLVSLARYRQNRSASSLARLKAAIDLAMDVFPFGSCSICAAVVAKAEGLRIISRSSGRTTMETAVAMISRCAGKDHPATKSCVLLWDTYATKPPTDKDYS